MLAVFTQNGNAAYSPFNFIRKGGILGFSKKVLKSSRALR